MDEEHLRPLDVAAITLHEQYRALRRAGPPPLRLWEGAA